MVELPFPPSSLSGHAKGNWCEADVANLRACYEQGVPVAEIAQVLGRSKGAIRNKASKLGITTRDDSWSGADLRRLEAAYADDPKRGELDIEGLAQELGRLPSAVCRKAQSLGLTKVGRKGPDKPKPDRRKYKTEAERSAARSETLRERHATTPHPMKGKTHTPEARKKISRASKKAWGAAPQERRDQVGKQLSDALAKNGGPPPRPKARWKCGWRNIGGQEVFFRSRWEANYARYLQLRLEREEIAAWEFEPETFWFENIKRGVRSYKPDFRVTETDGSSKLHEVKGWMDSRSRTTLKRMAKYHPEQEIVLIREKQYRSVGREFAQEIPDWEYGTRGEL